MSDKEMIQTSYEVHVIKKDDNKRMFIQYHNTEKKAKKGFKKLSKETLFYEPVEIFLVRLVYNFNNPEQSERITEKTKDGWFYTREKVDKKPLENQP
jgi:hypothetical protein